MVMVPVLVVMSGALAFSAFSGTITTNVNASAGYLSWSQQVTSNYTYENNTAVGSTFLPTAASTLPSGPNATEQGITVTNLAPGNWVEFNITITNTGSVGLMLKNVTISPSGADGLTNGTTAVSNFAYGMALGGTGYLYNVSAVPSGSIDNGGTFSYHIFLGLGSNSGNGYQESTFAVTITIGVVSDP